MPVQYYSPTATHLWQITSDATAGVTSATFTRNFRIIDMPVWVVTAAPGATLTVVRTRGGVNTTIATFDVSGTGPAPLTSGIDQSAGLLESGDTITVTASSAASVLNLFINLIQFSI